MIVRTGLAPISRDVNNNGLEKTTRGSESYSSDGKVKAQKAVQTSGSVPPVEQSVEGELLGRRRQRQYSSNEANFRNNPQESDTPNHSYNMRALAAYQNNVQLSNPQNQATYEQIDYFV